jgi:hypothetical protein
MVPNVLVSVGLGLGVLVGMGLGILAGTGGGVRVWTGLLVGVGVVADRVD